MRLLVLGGTHHVGRAFVEEALARGDKVTTLTTGRSGPPAEGAEARHADRLDPAAVAEALGEDTWDAVVDTWSHAPVAVQTSARLLAGRVGHYTYVSSRSVYSWPLALGADESAPVVDGDPASDDGSDYAAAKRGGELAVLEEFDGPSLHVRAGLVLGPYENVGRLPFWLNRIAAGGRVPCPGPFDRPLQYVDARDIARWVLDAASRGRLRPVQHRQPARAHHDRGAARGVPPSDRERRRAGVGHPGDGRGRRGRSPGPSCRSGCRRPASSRGCTTATCRRRTTPGWRAGRCPRPSPTPGPGCSARAHRPPPPAARAPAWTPTPRPASSPTTLTRHKLTRNNADSGPEIA